MPLEKGNSFSGFRLEEIREVPEISSTAYLFTHEKTGARLLKLLNSDDNRVFSICFRTPPADDTGLPHILEHSVLTGSRKFPTKEPFVELLKSSLNTFLNAMTYPDKTMYPVASKNEKDFFNLMDVYLDAVFHPNIHGNPYTLMQEGWHHELASRDGELSYSGVVYNEMKGAFSSPERVLYSRIQGALFPGTCYGFESGGEPEAIPDLTQEKFLEFHGKYYHPSNSYIYLYGNGDTERELAFIDGGYLLGFGRAAIDSSIAVQEPFPAMKEFTFEYPVSPGEETAGKSILSLSYASGRATDPEAYFSFEIMRHLLLGTPASPLKQALLKAGLGRDVLGIAENGILQPFFGIIVKDTDPDKKERFLSTVRGTLETLARDGIDRELVEASLNYNEFQLREAEYSRLPKGLYYHMRSMDSWLYGGDPLLHLNFAPTMAALRRGAAERCFEKFIEERLLGNPHAALVTLVPKPGLAEERERRTAEKLAKFRASLAPAELDTLVEKNRELKKRQSEPDSPESLAKLPTLELTDINPLVEEIPTQEERRGDITLLANDVPTGGITYLNLYFDTSAVEQPLLPYAGLLAGLLGKISTSLHGYSDLAKRISLETGGMSFYTESYSHSGSADIFYPKLIVRAKALDGRVERMMDLAGEIAASTDFGGIERVREVLKEMKSRYEMHLSDQGHVIAQKRLFSYFSPMEKHDDLVSGFSFYKFLAATEKDLDAKYDEVRSKLEKVRALIFRRGNLLASLTAGADGRKRFDGCIDSFAARLFADGARRQEYRFGMESLNEGLMLSQSQVQFVAKGQNFLRKGFAYSGTMPVLATIVRLDYLWNRVRVQGGAYGASMSINRNGNMAFSSYRDPNLSNTLSVYREAPAYLRSFNPGAREMTNYIIGTISNLDQHLTPQQKGEKAARLRISGISRETLQEERDRVLRATRADISSCAEILDALMKEECHCVLGSEIKLREEKRLFGRLVTVME
ncbi:MAG TPA: insulinase family protein [Spirochaetota bacterium]|nr:insulinase family protein [Spirochaetota bacterium]